jgi:hypothetical protein
VFWPRAVAFLIACAIAAPLSYYFVTSPSHKHPIEASAMPLPSDWCGEFKMNLHAVPLDETPAVAAADAVSRILSDARLRDGAELLDALEARRVELGLSNKACEAAAGLCVGHVTKVCGPSRQKNPTLRTLDRVMAALGMSWVLVIDGEKVARVQAQWRPRSEAKVRMRALSQTTISRARPIILSELAHIAAGPPWAGTEALAFVKSMSGKQP